jgi:hypothetical protein
VHYNFQNQTCICNVKCMPWIDILQNVNVSIRVVNVLSRHDIPRMSLGHPINYYCNIHYLTCILYNNNSNDCHIKMLQHVLSKITNCIFRPKLFYTMIKCCDGSHFCGYAKFNCPLWISFTIICFDFDNSTIYSHNF